MKFLLESYRAICAEAEQLKRQIARLEELMDAPRVSNLTGMPRSGKVSDGMDMVAQLADLKCVYQRALLHSLQLQAEVEKSIATLTPEERLYIRAQYIDGKKPRKIAEEQHYCEKTIRRKIDKAVKKLTKEEACEID